MKSEFKMVQGNVSVFKSAFADYIGIDVAPHGHLIVNQADVADLIRVMKEVEIIEAD